ncbi:MAG TPA: bifunctional adenosylcobinamide kinase/adenosylcobinamide-phosphate guanylyltransferase [Deltaproteobacteria bacterium]|nr:bifunctional adenosylcobinamide kinase/adenosylcobinamide-phosphate guanylyltransferase [Deltaproteobacteria bacterium]
MGNGLTFVLGGARSGKSAFALKLGEAIAGPRVYLATGQAGDAEMAFRIARHREERGDRWETIEEPQAIVAEVNKAEGVLLIDCLTLWISNLLFAGLDDKLIIKTADSLAVASMSAGARVIAVSNEVGLGIVPENPIARRFRDLSGVTNRIMAERASDVWFVAAGIPLKMK